MNCAKNFKWQLVVVALGFCLALTAKVGAQEIVNTEFPTPSTSVSGNFNTAMPVAENTAEGVAPQSIYTPANALAIRASNDLQQLNAWRMPREAGLLAAIAILILGCAIAKKIGDNRRADHRYTWNSDPVRAKRLPSRKPQPIHS